MNRKTYKELSRIIAQEIQTGDDPSLYTQLWVILAKHFKEDYPGGCIKLFPYATNDNIDAFLDTLLTQTELIGYSQSLPQSAWLLDVDHDGKLEGNYFQCSKCKSFFDMEYQDLCYTCYACEACCKCNRCYGCNGIYDYDDDDNLCEDCNQCSECCNCNLCVQCYSRFCDDRCDRCGDRCFDCCNCNTKKEGEPGDLESVQLSVSSESEPESESSTSSESSWSVCECEK